MPLSVNTKAEIVSDQSRLFTIPATVEEQSQLLDTSPNNVESVLSQSSDEEAVIKELVRMMEVSDEYETQLINGSQLLDNSRAGKGISQDTSPIGTKHLQMSITSEKPVFNPSKYSSPDERVVDGRVHSANTPGKYLAFLLVLKLDDSVS